MKKETYIFRIDRFTPETIPMIRLAQYMLQWATLLGNPERVHFRELRPGSARLVSCVESEAAPKVRTRLQQLKSDSAPKDLREPYETINRMLASDNAVGTIKRGSATIVDFPGRRQPLPVRVGPFNQITELQGQLIRVGGGDDTAHGLIVDGDGEIRSVSMNREQAKAISAMLYGPPLRIVGQGRWERTEEAAWNLIDMKLHSWEALSEKSLREGVTALRAIEGSNWSKEKDPHALLHRIRHGDKGAH
jgi:hypothetical protein